MILIISEDDIEEMSANIYQQLKYLGADVILIKQKDLPYKNNITVFMKDGKYCGNIYIGNEEINISDITAIYTRMGESIFEDEMAIGTKIQIDNERQVLFNTLFENIDAMVINRTKSQFFNSSKLFQAHIIKQYGFKIPNSIISNSKDEIINFIKNNNKNGIIYKSASSERSKVEKFKEEDFGKLNLIKNCPHLFQECVDGTDIRVHTLATGETFACSINTQTSDYRYDKERNITICDIPNKIKEACVKMTLDMGLYLSGIDLRKTKNDDYYCFEVNPSPAFSWYEEQTGLPISQAIAKMMINAKKYKKLAIRKY